MKLTQHEIQKIINEHQNWVNGNDGKRADLHRANLREAGLYGADLRGAGLYGANLHRADLREANLHGADLYGADLREANLREANLHRADLRGADLHGANLHGADLREASLPNFSIVPELGSFIAWKKCKNHLVKLLVPEDAKRVSSLIGRKCRASKAYVLEIFDSEGNETDDKIAYGKHQSDFEYIEGETVYPDKFDDSILIECSHGIHFFITKKEALEW